MRMFYKNIVVNSILWVFLTVSIAGTLMFIVGVNLVAWTSSNHTGGNISEFIPIFVIITFISLALLLTKRWGRRASVVLWLLLASSIFAGGTAYLYPRNFVYANYDYWGQHGMPDRPYPWEGRFWRPLIPFIPDLPPDY
jgi:hypothetical protein